MSELNLKKLSIALITLCLLCSASSYAQENGQNSTASTEPTTPTGTAQAPAPAGDADSAAKSPSRSDTHLFGVLPNYLTVSHGGAVTPIDGGQKFRLAMRNTTDPIVFPLVGIIAVTHRTYGEGLVNFSKQYGASLTDNTVGNILTSATLPALFRQDPRYFQRETGSAIGRLGYAASRVLITRGDSGHHQLNVSELAGTAAAAGFSNAYYPETERTVSGTVTRWVLQMTWDSVSNELKEWWPDINNRLHHHSP